MPLTDYMSKQKEHRIHRIGWLRAAVLGANDGIVSTASLIIGVASAGVAFYDIVLAGVAGVVAGAMSMAAGEFVSVSSQADTEKADIELEKKHLNADYDFEVRELTTIYVKRGLARDFAREVAIKLMEHDALAAHTRDELGITETSTPRPFQAAFASALTFALGAALPLLAVFIAPTASIAGFVAISSLLFLALLGGSSAAIGGAPIMPAITRVVGWGTAAMIVTAGAGVLFNIAA